MALFQRNVTLGLKKFRNLSDIRSISMTNNYSVQKPGLNRVLFNPSPSVPMTSNQLRYLSLSGHNAYMFSPREVEFELEKVNDNFPENKIIHITVINAIYPINVFTVHKICKSFGEVDRLVIFEKGRLVQAMVEFRTIASASEAKKKLHGCDIYNNACTLRVGFAKGESLTVKRNNYKTWDFTQTEDFGEANNDELNIQNQRTVLLDESPPAIGLGGLSRFVNVNSSDDGRNGMERSMLGDSFTGVGGSGGSPVLMVYNLDPDMFNCQKLFNLLCLYGNIARINFVNGKKGCAMVEFSDPEGVNRAVNNLNQIKMFGVKASLEQAKKSLRVDEISNPHTLPDGSESFQSFTRDRCNRFSNPERAAKNRLTPPTEILHFYNVPKIDDDWLIMVFAEKQAPRPTKVKWFETKSGKSTSGLLEFDTVEDSTEALLMVNNNKIDFGDEGQYHINLCFTRSYI